MAQVNPLRYRGYCYDADTDFYYLQSRFYDPEVRRFINADGYASTGQGFLGQNMFAYCNNCSVRFVDKLGDCPKESVHWEFVLDEDGVKLVVFGSYTAYYQYGTLTASFSFEILITEFSQDPNAYVSMKEDTLIITVCGNTIAYKVNELNKRLGEPSWICDGIETTLIDTEKTEVNVAWLTGNVTVERSLGADGITGDIAIELDANLLHYWLWKIGGTVDDFFYGLPAAGGGSGNFQGNIGGVGGGSGGGGLWGIPDFCSFKY